MNLKRTLIALITISLVAVAISYQPHAKAQTALTTISGKFYRLEVLAANNQNGVGSLSTENGSINDEVV